MKKSNHTVLVVAAHPDDELLGVGGTLLKHVSKGDEVHILILGDGENARDAGANVLKRAQCAHDAAKFLNATSIVLETFHDNRFDTHSLLSIVKAVEKRIAEISPDIVYTHHIHDLNVDHRRTCEAVLTAARPMEGSPVRTIYSFETVSATEWQVPRNEYAFCPQEYVDISNFFDRKIELLRIYDEEMRSFPHPRSYEGIGVLAKKRGMEVGYQYAEAFEIIRNLRD